MTIGRLGKRLGTVTEASEYLGHVDTAQTWEEITLGNLVAVRGEDPEHPSLWTVYLPDEDPEIMWEAESDADGGAVLTSEDLTTGERITYPPDEDSD